MDTLWCGQWECVIPTELYQRRINVAYKVAQDNAARLTTHDAHTMIGQQSACTFQCQPAHSRNWTITRPLMIVFNKKSSSPLFKSQEVVKCALIICKHLINSHRSDYTTGSSNHLALACMASVRRRAQHRPFAPLFNSQPNG